MVDKLWEGHFPTKGTDQETFSKMIPSVHCVQSSLLPESILGKKEMQREQEEAEGPKR